MDAHTILPTFDVTSTISRVIRKEKLPIAIRMRKEFSSKESPVVLTNGEMLLLCFVVEVPVVVATLGKTTKYRLPIYAKQLYERLPLGKLVTKIHLCNYYMEDKGLSRLLICICICICIYMYLFYT